MTQMTIRKYIKAIIKEQHTSFARKHPPFLLAILSDPLHKAGASLVEAALCFPFLFFGILAFLDLARYFMVALTLNVATFMGADFASKVEVEIATNQQSCDVNSARCAAYQARVQAILARVIQYANLISSASTQPGTVQRISFQHYSSPPYDSQFYQSGLAPFVSDAAFIRPGERVLARRAASGMADGWIDHLSRPFRTDASTANAGWPNIAAGENWARLLTAHPLIVYMEVVFTPFTPFVPRVIIKSSEPVFRQTAAYGIPVGALPPIVQSSASSSSAASSTSSAASTSSTSSASSSSSQAPCEQPFCDDQQQILVDQGQGPNAVCQGFAQCAGCCQGGGVRFGH